MVSPNDSPGTKQLEQLLASGDITMDELQSFIEAQQRLRNEFRKDLRAITVTAGQEVVPHLFTLSEAHNFLIQHGIDLNRCLQDEVKRAIRWGIIQAEEADTYKARFDEIQIPETDLQALATQMSDNPGLTPSVIFAIDEKPGFDAFMKLIMDAGIDAVVSGKRLSGYRRIDAETGEPSKYQGPTDIPGVLFIPKTLDVADPSLDVERNDLVQNQKYLGPVGWMMWFRQSLDAAISSLGVDLDGLSPAEYEAVVKASLSHENIASFLPDVNTETFFPNFRDADGVAPSFSSRKIGEAFWVMQNDCSPNKTYEGVRARPVFGTFLS